MKKKIINGILLVAVLVAASSAFVSCKDNDADVKTEMESKISNLQSQLTTLQGLINQIKSCDCDSYTKAEIDSKISVLKQAIDAIKVPSLDGYLKQGDLEGYLKLADLPEEVQKLLIGYYTKEEVDGLIAGLNIPDGWTKEQIQALINEAIAGISKGLTEAEVKELIDAAIAGINPGLNEEAVKKLIDDALKNYKPELPEIISKQEIESMINAEIKALEEKVNSIFYTQVTSVIIQSVENPVFGTFALPIDVRNNILAAYIGQASESVVFPSKGVEGAIGIDAGETLMSENAGKVYVTINPNTVNFEGKTLTLVNSQDEASPVTLSGLTKSDKVLSWGYTRSADNGFYEATASVKASDVKKLEANIDFAVLGDDIHDLIKIAPRTDALAAQFAADLYANIGNILPALAVKATWTDNAGGNHNVYSDFGIAATAIRPLSFAFDFDKEIAKDYEETIKDRLMYFVEVDIKPSASITDAIAKFIDAFNARYVDRTLNRVNWMLQPTLLVLSNNKMTRANGAEVSGSNVTLVPTSNSAELFAPAYKKYVAIKAVDGDEDAAKALNTGLLGTVIDGSVREIPFTAEAGKTYTITYAAVDYFGNVVENEYSFVSK
ncbi:MAG: hypothetical protein IJ868_08160 [Prevotella sp.]|nr:hypothetical protein [Prevotella sp.]